MNKILTKPLKLGERQAKNHMVAAAINLRPYGQINGAVNENHIRMYEEYGQSGFGMIVTDAINIDQRCQSVRAALGCWADWQIEGLHILAEKIKQDGALAVMQLAHRGFTCHNASSLENVGIEELLYVQEEFVQAAMRAQKAGFDGIELHACHGYFLNQILSEVTNFFPWQYSGSIANRAKYVAEIIENIKIQCRKDFIIGVRMGCNEPNIESSIKIAKIFEQAGANYLSITKGIGKNFCYGEFDDDMDLEEKVPSDFGYGNRIFGAWKIKQQVKIPVVCVGNIRNIEDADIILKKEYADMVAVGRARLADPQWLKKSLNNKKYSSCFGCKTCMWFTIPSNCPARKNLKYC